MIADAELRCDGNKMHGIVTQEYIEVRCPSRFCGSKDGVVVIHRFTHSGDLIETVKFKDPAKGIRDATQHHPASVRS